MNWRKRYEKFKPGDRVRIIKIYRLEGLYIDYKVGDVGTLRYSDPYNYINKEGNLWDTDEFNIPIFESEFEKVTE